MYKVKKSKVKIMKTAIIDFKLCTLIQFKLN